MASYKIIAPLRVKQTKLKMYTLNLNTYRNTHFQVLNKVKKEYKAAITDQLKDKPHFHNVKIRYVLYVKTNRLCDISNVLSIHDKFFCDALVELDKLPEDNYQHLQDVQYCYGGKDKDNPRVEILVTEVI